MIPQGTLELTPLATINDLLNTLPADVQSKFTDAVLKLVVEIRIKEAQAQARGKNPTATNIGSLPDLTPAMLAAGKLASAEADAMARKEYHLGKDGFAYREKRVAHIYHAIQQAFIQEQIP